MLRSKMREYMDADVQLGWLINPQQQQVEIYQKRTRRGSAKSSHRIIG